MPSRKRRTKQSTCGQSMDIHPEQKKESQLFLKDFEEQAKKRIEALYKARDAIPKQMELTLTNFLLQIPEEVCEMPWEKFLECGGTVEGALAVLKDDKSQPFNNTEATLLQSARKKPTKAPRQPLSSASVSESDEAELSVASTKTRLKKKGTAKKGIPPQSTRASRYKTPALSQKSLCYTDTPLVTPALDPRLPMNRSVRFTSLSSLHVDTPVIEIALKDAKTQMPVHFTRIDFDVNKVTIPEMDSDIAKQIAQMHQLLGRMMGQRKK